MGVKNIVQAIPLTNIASASLTANYKPINAGGLTASCFLIRFNSTSTTDVTISYDGVNDHEFLLHGNYFNIFAQTNSQPNNYVAQFPKGMVVYVKGVAGDGNIYLSGYMQPSGL